MILRVLFAVIGLLAFAPHQAAAQTTPLSALYVNDRYDPHADPYRDLDRAIDRASTQNEHILIIVGGEWCTSCEVLDRILVADSELRAAFEDAFVMVKVNWSSQNQNAAFLSGFPRAEGFPAFFVLDSNGVYLQRQDARTLEVGAEYDRNRMLAFAQRWHRD